MEIALFLWLMCGIVAAMIGSRKGAGCAGFALGFLLGPFGILIALFMGGNRKACPYCRELIHKEAIVCPRCQRDLVAMRANPRSPDDPFGAPPR